MPAIWLLIGGLAAASAMPAAGQARELLNSERIEQRFGSYGLDVLAQDAAVRVSSLYSTHEGVATCRTFAIVRYPTHIDPLLGEAHAAIVAGGSIGAVFTAQGWQVRKTHLHYGALQATGTLAGLMRVAPGTRLAAHVYVLDVVKSERALEYAALVEIHHPDYLQAADLELIYGPVDAHRADLVSSMLALAAERSR
jgi:hypothetical protein